MEAIKMQNTVQVKAKTGSRTATGTSSATQSDDFIKLLQEKRDLTETEKSQNSQAQDKTDDSKAVKDSAPEKTEEKVEKSEQENIPKEDVLGEDALLQAVIQQTAVQMAIVVPEVQEPVQEAVQEIAKDSGIVPAENLSVETPTAAAESEAKTAEAMVEPVVQQPEEKGRDTSFKEENPNQNNIRDFSVQEKSSDDEPVQAVKSSQPPVQTERKAEPEEGQNQQPVSGIHDVKGQTEQVPVTEKSQEIPLKTTQADLPQDLGKTLASRLPGTGQELTVELEPASLGKLTIKLVYEGDRAAVSILASNPKTLELLSQKAAEIASILEEKTGQQTIIYTQPAQQENPDPDQEQGGKGSQQNREEGQQNREEDRHQTESFAQQLRLGLV